MSSIDERIWCDFGECPLKDECRNYADGFNKLKTVHWGAYPFPYKKLNGECIGFEALTQQDIIDKIASTVIGKP